MKRNLLVPNENEALKLMKAFLASQMVASSIDVDDSTDGEARPFIKLAWLTRDFESDDWLGCPCFVCDFHGTLPNVVPEAVPQPVRGIVYVKVFPTQVVEVTKMQIVDENDFLYFGFNVIDDDDTIKMHDKLGRYEDETFIFKDGEIIPL